MARVSILVLFLILKKNLSAFPHQIECCLWGFYIWYSLCWSMFPLYSLCWGPVCLNVEFEPFSVSNIEMDKWFLPFNLNVMYHVCWFTLLDHPCIPGINPTWSQWKCIVEFSLLMFCSEFFHLYSSGTMFYSSVSCSILYIWLDVREMLAL